ncbi:DUF6520 family protein [Myroides injenensis]|uniref:DUF6520 family protein n=1 Tax=Myroides injenensis TaxID=1183151 RepID=UPI00028A19CA|nr:DUF6520 family protein [Myroides injenensis]
MKKFLKTAGLPIGVFALAISAAFATNAIKNSELADPIAYYRLNPNDQYSCMKTSESCTTIPGQICKWVEVPGILEHDLYEISFESDGITTYCSKPLYRK